jgi:hypothetical protein
MAFGYIREFCGGQNSEVVRAPGLQPDHTGPATTVEQGGDMANRPESKGVSRDTKCEESLPPLQPGREVGWVFKNGEVVAIERHECEHRFSEETH